jgi:hypothetical protein
VKIINRLNKRYGGDALQRTNVYCWIKDVKSGRRHLSNVSPQGRAPDEGLHDGIAKALRKDPHLPTRNSANALKISCTTVRTI